MLSFKGQKTLKARPVGTMVCGPETAVFKGRLDGGDKAKEGKYESMLVYERRMYEKNDKGMKVKLTQMSDNDKIETIKGGGEEHYICPELDLDSVLEVAGILGFTNLERL